MKYTNIHVEHRGWGNYIVEWKEEIEGYNMLFYRKASISAPPGTKPEEVFAAAIWHLYKEALNLEKIKVEPISHATMD
jgi:hypothetical protein